MAESNESYSDFGQDKAEHDAACVYDNKQGKYVPHVPAVKSTGGTHDQIPAPFRVGKE